MQLPDLAELVALRAAAHGLSLHAHRPALAAMQGPHRGIRGRGLEFEEVRPYAAGDDVRSIDWRVTARRGRPHTRLYREERERPVWLLADLHPGLYFGSRRQLKSALLLRAAALLGWVAALGGDRIGALISQTEAEPLILPPRAREVGVLPLLNALVAVQPRAPGIPANNLGAALASLRPLLHPGSLVLLLSDFASLDTQAEAALAGICLHNDCHLFWLTDPLEAGGLPNGQYRVGLPGRLWWLDGAGSRPTWQAAWGEREARVDGLARRLVLPLTRLSTAEAVADSLPPRLFR